MIRTKYLLVLAAACVGMAGCQNAANTTSNAATNANTAAVNMNTNSTAAANTPPATGDDPGDINGTPTQVYKAAYTARKNCDVAGLKKVMSQKLLAYLTKKGKEVKKSLDDVLNDICKGPQASTEQVRNETINGDHASIEYLDENDEWQTMDFVRQEGVWK
ncbi:MAG TPA: hypothetical protein VGI80_05805, partial [Pyrinomonadaceae bacterium]